MSTNTIVPRTGGSATGQAASVGMSGIASGVEPAPDGRFIGAVARRAEPDAPITIVLNWKP